MPDLTVIHQATSLCYSCRRAFNGRLLEIRSPFDDPENPNTPRRWVVQMPSPLPYGMPEERGCSMTWQALAPFVRGCLKGTLDTIESQPVPPATEIALHSTPHCLRRSSALGCQGCFHLFQHFKARRQCLTKTYQLSIRGLPMIIGKKPLSPMPHGPLAQFTIGDLMDQELELRIWYPPPKTLLRARWANCPPANDGIPSAISMSLSTYLRHLDRACKRSKQARAWRRYEMVQRAKRDVATGPRLYTPQLMRSGQYLMDKLRSWMCHCEAHHKTCGDRRALFEGHYPLGPQRLLCVSVIGQTRMVRLVETDQLARGLPAFTALSCCWGGPFQRSIMTLTRHTYSELQQGVEWKDMPRTVQGAFAVTWALGFPCIWVEALCVMQDSIEDWHGQARQLGAVFGCAEVTIAATASQSIDSGLFLSHEQTADTASQPLNRSAWALQERAMSTRLIEFDGNQIRTRCRGQCHQQALTDNEGVEVYTRPLPNPETLFESKEGWTYFLSDFSTREVQVARHRRHALAAAVKSFARCHGYFDSDYLAGHWRDTLPRSLLWIMTSPIAELAPEDAPSWSWLSVPGKGPLPIQFMNRGWDWERVATAMQCRTATGTDTRLKGPHFQTDFEVENTAITHAGGHSYTDFHRESYLQIRCPIIPLCIISLNEANGVVACIVGKLGEATGKYHGDYASPQDGLVLQPMFFIPLALYLYPWSGRPERKLHCIDGLVVVTTRAGDARDNAYRRVGVLRVHKHESVPPMWKMQGEYHQLYVRSIRLY